MPNCIGKPDVETIFGSRTGIEINEFNPLKEIPVSNSKAES